MRSGYQTIKCKELVHRLHTGQSRAAEVKPLVEFFSQLEDSDERVVRVRRWLVSEKFCQRHLKCPGQNTMCLLSRYLVASGFPFNSPGVWMSRDTSLKINMEPKISYSWKGKSFEPNLHFGVQNLHLPGCTWFLQVSLSKRIQTAHMKYGNWFGDYIPDSDHIFRWWRVYHLSFIKNNYAKNPVEFRSHEFAWKLTGRVRQAGWNPFGIYIFMFPRSWAPTSGPHGGRTRINGRK